MKKGKWPSKTNTPFNKPYSLTHSHTPVHVNLLLSVSSMQTKDLVSEPEIVLRQHSQSTHRCFLWLNPQTNVLLQWQRYGDGRQAGEVLLKRGKRVFTTLCTPHTHCACHMNALPFAAARYSHCLPWQDLTSVGVLYMIYIQYAATLDIDVAEIPTCAVYSPSEPLPDRNTRNRWALSARATKKLRSEFFKDIFKKFRFQETEEVESLRILKSWLVCLCLKYPETF